MKRNKKGFTLVELLVVIAIIGLLATIAVVALSAARRSSRDAKRIADVRQTQTGLELYFNDKLKYPTCTTLIRVAALSTATGQCAAGLEGFLAGLTSITDPSTTATACSGTSSAVCDYGFSGDALGASYSVYFYMEGNSGSLTTGIHTGTPTGLK